MKLTICFLLLCAFVYVRATDKSFDTSDGPLETLSIEGILGYLLEMLLDKFDDLDRKLIELKSEMNVFHEKTFNDFAKNVDRDLSVLQNRSMGILEQQKSCVNNNRLHERLFNHIATKNHSSYKTLEQTLLSFRSRISDSFTSPSSPLQLHNTTPTTPKTVTLKHPPILAGAPTYASCKDAPANVSGVYLIRVNNSSAPFKVYCKMEKFEGGWTVVQHRFDGSVDFYRDWAQYRDGFGDLESEFWLGLEHIHQLTTARTHELIVEVKDFKGNAAYARYSAFQVGSEREQYSLKSLGSYSGTAGDSLIGHKGRMFSTKDRDNDERPEYHLAITYQGGWWYNGGRSNLNGRYKDSNDVKQMFWWTVQSGTQGLSFARMMIREL